MPAKKTRPKESKPNSPANRILVEKSKASPKNGREWFRLGNTLRNRGDQENALKAYRKALEDPKFETPGYAWNNLGLILREKGEFKEAIEAHKQALADPNYDTPGIGWNNLGVALRETGDFDGAIDAHKKALKDPKYKNPGRAWNNLGSAYRHKGLLKEAIRAHRKALADPKYDTPAYAWNNLGTALVLNGQVDEAIKAYQTALNDPKIDKPGYVWNNLGLAYHAKGQLTHAIKAFKKALADPKYDTSAKAWANLAQAYLTNKNPSLAKSAFKRALKCQDKKGKDHARARLGLRMLSRNIGPSALSADDRALVEKIGPSVLPENDETAIIAEIKAAGNTQYDRYIAEPNSGRDDVLSILRGWSSAVTLLEGSERKWRGGGYFVKWKGCGVVIDPGFDFLRNFHDAKYHGREINVVIACHNHPDHNSDLKAIDDLRYELFMRPTARNSKTDPYILIWDQDSSVATKFASDAPAHRHDSIFLRTFPKSIDLSEHIAAFPIRIVPFKVNHGKDVPNAMGVVVELLDKDRRSVIRIGYTSDTAYFDSLHKNLLKCDILIAHISQPSIDELQDANKLKETHLGYRGVIRLVKECSPRLALIGEFWAGLTDLRIPLVKGLRRQSGLDAILPAGIKLDVRLPSLEIVCTKCGEATPFQQVKVAPANDSFGNLAYLCPKCLLH